MCKEPGGVAGLGGVGDGAIVSDLSALFLLLQSQALLSGSPSGAGWAPPRQLTEGRNFDHVPRRRRCPSHLYLVLRLARVVVAVAVVAVVVVAIEALALVNVSFADLVGLDVGPWLLLWGWLLWEWLL